MMTITTRQDTSTKKSTSTTASRHSMLNSFGLSCVFTVRVIVLHKNFFWQNWTASAVVICILDGAADIPLIVSSITMTYKMLQY